ncbi:hypothetical protein SpiGrapes_1375 [Sphaerochaeta pleomorpha str. Grapes]|uniref:Uncharacterized protein n=1 Tax=Sphaerochaeta pleomorpha (strain ATCC BAA-1885 / DSM 22778 / Grapes) TaxID=158190 RepID=G8QUF4_SPHPG|nr:hypothetical protein [Sphaerochaeta pleomorpha]AEV29187.1 hypothetical protein SpiGrapes_1375 [Sphaerochaeta pleomorpha str. Grapes]
MKKNFIALVLVALVASFGLFAAALPQPAELNLSTTISGINLMKLTTDQFNPATPSLTLFNNAPDNETTEVVSSAADTGTIAYLSILTNKRTGFTVTMTAEALDSATVGNDFLINYVVTAGTATYDTSNGSGTNTITVNSGIAGLTAFSYPVSVDLNDTEYDAALEDTYTGTVTFTYTTNA